jgi:hypothetical protein
VRSQELELWAQDVARRAIARRPSEADSRVELKRAWPAADHGAARQLAAHANAAGGDPILWIIGIHERTGEAPGADDTEISNWLSAIRSWFDGAAAPRLARSVVTRIGDALVPIVALLFETDGAPYVVRVESCGPVTREVPWREGGSTRTATHEDLVRMLVPIARRPDIEVLRADVRTEPKGPARTGDPDTQVWRFEADIYVTAKSGELLTMPFYRCELEIAQRDAEPIVRTHELRLMAPRSLRRTDRSPGLTTLNESATVENTRDEVHIQGSGLVIVQAFGRLEPDRFDEGAPVNITLHCAPVNTDSIRVQTELLPTAPRATQVAAWRWVHPKYTPRA